MPTFLKVEFTESEIHGFLWIIDRMAEHKCVCEKCRDQYPPANEAFKSFNQKVVGAFTRRMQQ